MLTEIANRYALDKGTTIPNDGKHHGPRLNFTLVYEKWMDSIRNDVKKIVEIGVENGNSLKMWSEYFPKAKIYGIDINDKSIYNTDRITCYQCDQSDSNKLLKTMDLIGNDVDVIIDDGSHVVSHQQTTLAQLFPYVKRGGMFWVEDLHTSDRKVWQGKTLYGNDMSFVEGTSMVDVIEDMIKYKKFKSVFNSKDENKYIEKHTDMVELFDLGKTFYGFNKLAVFLKK